MPHLDYEGDVAILHLGDASPTAHSDPEHRFHPEWMARLHGLLDEVEAGCGARALVTVGAGKFYSTGADLSWATRHPGEADAYLSEIQRLFARILLSPVPTVAAVQGHAFGAGAFLAIAHDRTIMREDRGYFCLPGISLGAAYAPGTVALATSRLGLRAAHEALVTGRRYRGPEALIRGLVDELASEHDVLGAAVNIAAQLAPTRGQVLADIKHQMYRDVVAQLYTPVAGYNEFELQSTT